MPLFLCLLQIQWLCLLMPTHSAIFRNLNSNLAQLGTTCSNTWAYKGHSYSKDHTGWPSYTIPECISRRGSKGILTSLGMASIAQVGLALLLHSLLPGQKPLMFLSYQGLFPYLAMSSSWGLLPRSSYESIEVQQSEPPLGHLINMPN